MRCRVNGSALAHDLLDVRAQSTCRHHRAHTCRSAGHDDVARLQVVIARQVGLLFHGTVHRQMNALRADCGKICDLGDRAQNSGVIAQLEARGYLERVVSEADRRARSLRLTETGAALLDAIAEAVLRAQDVMLQGLTATNSSSCCAK